MKKLIQCLPIILLLSVFTPVQAKAEKETPAVSMNSDKRACESSDKAMYTRLKTIRQMTKHDLSKAEKKALREEVLSIQSRYQGPVIFISTGALILIIILLIILL